MRGEIIRYLWKIRRCVQKTASADELISIREHHRQIFIFETWRESLDLQSDPRKFFFVSFSLWLFTVHVYKIERFFGEKTKKWEGNRILTLKIPSTILETRYWWAIAPNVGVFQSSVLEIKSREGTKDIVWEAANFLYNEWIFHTVFNSSKLNYMKRPRDLFCQKCNFGPTFIQNSESALKTLSFLLIHLFFWQIKQFSLDGSFFFSHFFPFVTDLHIVVWNGLFICGKKVSNWFSNCKRRNFPGEFNFVVS